ncbi:DUF488 domain-containing protein [Ruminococcaceae bacterium OttesenSCG-928-I18]|nr:DUF488 domain-containing protein [Ruminococcaceae bacterium OttesenSCG-928-I18]
MGFRIKRVYDPYEQSDGKRVLVDRLWPRGMSRERAKLDEWMKDVAPSPALRTWFSHKTERFDEFSRRYLEELRLDGQKQPALKALWQMGREGTVTLLYGARDPKINHAAVLLSYLREHEE